MPRFGRDFKQAAGGRGTSHVSDKPARAALPVICVTGGRARICFSPRPEPQESRMKVVHVQALFASIAAALARGRTASCPAS